MKEITKPSIGGGGSLLEQPTSIHDLSLLESGDGGLFSGIIKAIKRVLEGINNAIFGKATKKTEEKLAEVGAGAVDVVPIDIAEEKKKLFEIRKISARMTERLKTAALRSAAIIAAGVGTYAMGAKYMRALNRGHFRRKRETNPSDVIVDVEYREINEAALDNELNKYNETIYKISESLSIARSMEHNGRVSAKKKAKVSEVKAILKEYQKIMEKEYETLEKIQKDLASKGITSIAALKKIDPVLADYMKLMNNLNGTIYVEVAYLNRRIMMSPYLLRDNISKKSLGKAKEILSKTKELNSPVDAFDATIKRNL